MALSIYETFVGAIVALLIWTLVTRIRNWARLRHIRGPPTAAWSKFWLVRHQYSGRLLQHFRDVSKQYGPLARVGPNWLLLSSASEIRRIWSVRSGYHRSPWYAGLRFDPNSDSIITMTDNKAHLRIRTHLLPVYQGRGLPDQEAIVDGQVVRFVRMVEEKYLSTGGVGGGSGLRPFEMGRKFMYFTQDAISAVEFGEPFGYMEADDDFYGTIDALESMMMPCAIMSLLPAVLWLVTSPVGKLFLPRKTDKSGVGRLLGVIGERVGERYAEKGERKNDVLQGIVESGLSREEVEAEALVHILGGTDTTAAALRNAVFFLSTSPSAYRRLQDEIDGVVGRVSRPVIADAECKELSFLQACIREAMRMWPPISGIQAKISDTDDVICGVKVPAGTHIAMGWFEIMRDKAVFGVDAEVFEPRRWLEAEPERLKEMEAVQGLTFSLGTRWECLGKRLANMEMSKVLFELFLRFDFAMTNPAEPFRWEHKGLTVHQDMNVTITNRDPRTV